MKLTTQLAVVICVAIAGVVAMIYFLTQAGWSEGGIAGLCSGILTAVGTLVVVVRNQVKQADVLEQMQRQIGAGQRDQASTLDTVVEQTNGKSSRERQDIAERAAAATVATLKQEGHL